MEFDSILDQSSSMTGDILQDATDLESKGIKKDTTTDDYMVFSRGGNWVKKKLLRYGKNWGFMKDGRGFLLRISKLPERRAALNHAKILIDLITQFPTTNNPEAAEIDLTALVSNIRARYRLLCASLGVKPRMTTAAGSSSNVSAGQEDGSANGNMVEGVEGPIKGVDTSKLKF